MSKLRSARPAPRRLVRLGVGAATAALVLVPGTAWATDGGSTSPTQPDTSSLTTLQQQGQQALDQATGLLGGGTQTPGDTGTGADPTATTPTDTSAADTPAAPTLPPQLQAVLEQLGVSSQCSDAVQADLTQALTDIPGSVQAIIEQVQEDLTAGQLPSSQDVLAELAGQLGITLPGGTATADQGSTDQTAADSGTGVPVLDDLQQLVTDLTTTCAPSLPAAPSTPPTTAPEPVAAETTPVATPEAAQPVSYPGYAATGAIAPASSQHPVDTAPLAALGGGALLVSAAATAAVRSRARRSGR